MRREFTTCNSINAATTFAVVHACETAVRELYGVAVGSPFPHEDFRPNHVPESLATRLGIISFYSQESRSFLSRLTGFALQDVRYEGTRAFQQHTAKESAGRGRELLDGATHLIDETEKLADDAGAVQAIRASASALRRESNDTSTG